MSTEHTNGKEHVGDLKGFWLAAFRVTVALIPIAVPIFAMWLTWTTTAIFELQAQDKVIAQVTHQISVNTPKIAQQEQAMAALTEWKKHAEAMLSDNAKQHDAILKQLEQMQSVLTEVRILLAKKISRSDYNWPNIDGVVNLTTDNVASSK